MFKHPLQTLVACTILLGTGIAGCAAPTPPPITPPVPVPVTGTPVATVFVMPDTPTSVPTSAPPTQANPGPAPVEALALPQSCVHEGLPTFVTRAGGFCFAYPQNFVVGETNPGQPAIYGPALDASPDPLRASFTFEVRGTGGKSLADSLSAYLLETGTSPETKPDEINVGGEAGRVVDPVKGRPNARTILLIHGDNLYILLFAPTLKDTPASGQTDIWKKAQQDMETLYGVVTSSFGFLPPGTAAQPMPRLTEISWQTAQEMILGGQVKSVTQAHSLQVDLTLADGRVLHTVEPQIDDVLRVIDRCGDPCRGIAVATE